MSSTNLLEIKEIREELNKAPAFLSIQEAASILGVGYQTLYRLVVVGEISATKVAGIWRIPRRALLEYLEARSPLNMVDDKL